MAEQKSPKVVITGGTEGIGKAIAEEFLAEHASVAICARTKVNLEKMVARHRELIAEQCDLSEAGAPEHFIGKVVHDLDGLDILILNAAVIDLYFKKFGIGKSEAQTIMRRINEDSNIHLIENSKEVLKKSSGVIIFLVTRFISQSVETASKIGFDSKPAKDDIGEYIRNKNRVLKYLDEFAKDARNKNILVFSVIPGTVDTGMNRTVIEFGNSEMREAKLQERREGRERDPRSVGRVIARMATTRSKFNSSTLHYDIPIETGEIIEISNAAIEFEEGGDLNSGSLSSEISASRG